MYFKEYEIIAKNCSDMIGHCRAALVPLLNIRPALRNELTNNQIKYWQNCISAYKWMAGLSWQKVVDKHGRQPQAV